MVVHYDKLKAVVGSTPVSWLGTEVEGTPVVVGDENVQDRNDRTKRPVDVVAVDTVVPSVNVKCDRAPDFTHGQAHRYTVLLRGGKQ